MSTQLPLMAEPLLHMLLQQHLRRPVLSWAHDLAQGSASGLWAWQQEQSRKQHNETSLLSQALL